MAQEYTDDIREFMSRELGAIQYATDNVDQSINEVIEKILDCQGKVIFTGVGKSGHIAEKLAATFASTGTPSFFVHSTEGLHGDLGMIEADDLVIAISNSGETKEVLNLVPSLKRIGCILVSISRAADSTLAERSDIAIVLPVHGEADDIGLAPTNSSTEVLVLGDAIGMTLARARNFQPENFAVFHPGGALGKKLLGGEHV